MYICIAKHNRNKINYGIIHLAHFSFNIQKRLCMVVKRFAGRFRLIMAIKKTSLTSFPIKSLKVLSLGKDDILGFHNFAVFLMKTKNGCNVKAQTRSLSKLFTCNVADAQKSNNNSWLDKKMKSIFFHLISSSNIMCSFMLPCSNDT